MKKNLVMRIAAVVLMCTLVTACFASSTFAKYTSSVEANDAVTVAKWSFKVNGSEIATDNPTITFNLFDTINDTGNTADEKDVVDGKIAPGTAGKFELKVANPSEVTAQYAIDYEVTNDSSIPIKWKVNNGEWSNSLADVIATDATKLAAGAAEATVQTIEWMWDFDDNGAGTPDESDTDLGIAARGEAAPSITVTATITATQVD